MRIALHQETCFNNQFQEDDVLLNASISLKIPGGILTLREKQLLHVHDAIGWTIKALTGTLWITQESDSRDIVLYDGDSFILDREGTALVTSLGEANVFLKNERIKQPKTNIKTASGFYLSFLSPRALFS